MFLPSFVPVAEDQSGSDLFVDLRDGPQRGCVTAFVKGDADNAGPQWPSMAAMLTAVADALHRNALVGIWRPRAVEGRLHWDIDIPWGRAYPRRLLARLTSTAG